TRLNKRIDDTKQELKEEISGTKQELRGEMGQVETRLNKRIDDTKQELKTDIKQSEERLNKRMDRTDTRILWSTLITTLLVAFMNIFGKEAFHSLFNAAVDIFEKVLSFFS
ncbi:MAG: hypothetical protein ISN29_12715, partial [Gammaproteobacteria bacterium AqS3]|nr:hypothetical protein [Gammaproteobacteria bacterium AqS3]